MADKDEVLTRAHILQLAAGGLLAMGLIMVHSASLNAGSTPMGPLEVVQSRHAIYAALALIAMTLASRINIRHVLTVRGLASPVGWMVVIAMVLTVLAMVPGIGRSANGAYRWLWVSVGPVQFSFQPSELLKWVMVGALALWCTRRSAVMSSVGSGLFPPLVLLGGACALVVIEDLGTAALMGVVGMTVLLAGGARFWHVALLLPAGFGIVYAAIATSPYRIARLMAFLNPWADPEGIGYHPIQSMLAIAEGGLTGRGLGNGIQKLGYLPEDTTDFIFAVVCEELGLAGATAIVGLFLIIIWAGLGVVRDSRDLFGRLLALGIVMTIGLQALVNLAVVTVLVPTKGIALPLVSAGGTGWIVTAFAIGLLAAIDEANRVNADDEQLADNEEWLDDLEPELA